MFHVEQGPVISIHSGCAGALDDRNVFCPKMPGPRVAPQAVYRGARGRGNLGYL